MKLKNLIRIILLVAILLLLTIVPVNAVISNNGAFDSDYYVNSYEDLKAVYSNNTAASYDHFVVTGLNEWRRPSITFDAKVYLEKNPDVAAGLGNNPRLAYEHFLASGMAEHRVASNEFVVDIYLANYPDVKAAYGNNMASVYNQYVYSGIAEGRIADRLVAGAEDHEHEWELTKTLITPSCISDGEAEYTCKCGETKTEVIKASEEYHDYRKIRTLQAPTIDKVGIDVYECTYCKDTITKVVDALGCEHNYVVEYNHPATCTKEGEKKEYCTKCGEEKIEKLPLADHVSSTPEGRGTITKAVVDCLVDGAEDVVCDECRQIFSRPISAHKYEKVSEVAATCNAEGVITYKCTVCNATTVEVTDKLEHNYEVVSTTPATCTKNGVEVKACNLCGDVVSKVLPATGHVKPATADRTANNYALGFVEVDAKGKYVVAGGDDSAITGVTAKTEADCTHDLVEVYWCEGCESLQVEVVERKSGHVMDTSKDTVQGSVECDVEGNPIIVKDEEGNIVVTEGGKADCRHAEIKVFRCKNCGESEYTVITKKLNHTPLAGSVVTYAPTCTEDGYRTYTCTTCPRGNQQVTEPTGVKATGHKYEYVAATCTEDACIKCANAKCEEKVVTTSEALEDLDATTKAAIIKILTDNGFKPAEEADADAGIAIGDYVLPEAKGHDFTVGTAVKVTTVDGVIKYTLACAECGKDIVVTLDDTDFSKTTKATVDGKDTAVAVDEQGILRVKANV